MADAVSASPSSLSISDEKTAPEGAAGVCERTRPTMNSAHGMNLIWVALFLLGFLKRCGGGVR